MTGTIFMEALRRNWRSAVYWGIGFGLYAIMIMLLIPNVDVLKQYAELVEKMPPALLQMFGLEGGAASIGTPEGFLGFGYFTYVMFLLAVYAVLAGLNITSNEEDQGIMDVVLSLPVPRWRVVLERLAAYAIHIVVIIVLIFVGLLIGLQLGASNVNSAFNMDMGKLFQASVNLLPGTFLMLAITAFMGTIIRRKNMVTAITTLIIVASYLINYLGAAATGTFADQLRFASFFYYIDSSGVITNGLNWSNIVVLVVAGLVLSVGSVWAFQRRDVGV